MKRFSNQKWKVVLSCLFSMMPLFVGLVLWNKLPDRLPTHFNYLGEPDQYSSRGFTVFGLGSILFVLNILALYITGRDPKNVNVSESVMNMVLLLVPFLALYLSLLVYGSVLGVKLSVEKWSMLLMGGMFVLIGNYLPKCRQNHTIGIRLPWTLNDAEVWDRTHRLAGYLYVLTGIAIIVSALLVKKNGFIVFMVMMMVTTLFSIIYPCVIYRRRHAGEEKQD